MTESGEGVHVEFAPATALNDCFCLDCRELNLMKANDHHASEVSMDWGSY